MKSKVITVTEVTLEIQKTNPPTLLINAGAEVSNPRWSDGELIPYVYKTAPPNGIYDFDFVARAQPGGIVPEPSVELKAEPFEWQGYPDTLKGVKVHASTNSIVALLDQKRSKPGATGAHPFNKVTNKELQKLKHENDQFFITNAFIWEDVLHISVRYGGGCKKHDFQLAWDGNQAESLPPQISLALIHNSNDDPCKAIVTEELQFVLSQHIKTDAAILLDGWVKPLNFKN